MIKSQILFSIFSLSLVAGLYFGPITADAAKCGRGCQRSMDDVCTVEKNLWDAAVASGIRMTSCCRSPQYNALLASCGYAPARNSAHMTGQAIDLALSPSNCTKGYLQGRGFPNICPYYHANHCHVSSRCGSASTATQAGHRTRERATGIREHNRDRATGTSRRSGVSSRVTPDSRRYKPRNIDHGARPWTETFWSEISR